MSEPQQVRLMIAGLALALVAAIAYELLAGSRV
jgi:hypothetical protein